LNNEPAKNPRAIKFIEFTERFAYFGAAAFLLVTIGMIFFPAGVTLLDVVEAGSLQTALEVLDRVLLVFIFAELLGTVITIVRENEVRAEPFLLIGLIAVVRRILAVTASNEQSLGSPEFISLLYELGILTVLVLALAGAFYFIRRDERAVEDSGNKELTSRWPGNIYLVSSV
jgi:uncharacterized membrane protein (DUF373 family)